MPNIRHGQQVAACWVLPLGAGISPSSCCPINATGFVGEHAADLAQAVVKTLPAYTDAGLACYVLQQIGGSSPVFLCLFQQASLARLCSIMCPLTVLHVAVLQGPSCSRDPICLSAVHSGRCMVLLGSPAADSRRAVQQFVSAAVVQDAFLKALAGGVVKQEKTKLKPHVSSPGQTSWFSGPDARCLTCGQRALNCGLPGQRRVRCRMLRAACVGVWDWPAEAKCVRLALPVQEAAALVGWAAAILGQLDVGSTKKAVVKLLECQVGPSGVPGRVPEQRRARVCVRRGCSLGQAPAWLVAPSPPRRHAAFTLYGRSMQTTHAHLLLRGARPLSWRPLPWRATRRGRPLSAHSARCSGGGLSWRLRPPLWLRPKVGAVAALRCAVRSCAVVRFGPS